MERGRFDVAFDGAIDAVTVLPGLTEERRAEDYGALRLPVEVEAIIALSDDARLIDPVDISQHGAGFRYDRVLDRAPRLI